MRHYYLISLLLVVILSIGQSQSGGKTESQSNHHSASTQSNTNDIHEVILATQRNRRLHVFDANTLRPLGYFTVNDNAHSVVASPDGLRLFIEQPAPPDANGCCALFSLDLVTHKLCKLIFPSSLGAPSPDGRWLFTQRGNIGIEVFDAKTLVRLPRIDAPGLYLLLPSPDSRWLFGLTNSQRGHGPSLDIFDIENKVLVRRFRLLKLDASNGAVVAERALEQDVWFMWLAKLPASAIPQGEVQPKPCESC